MTEIINRDDSDLPETLDEVTDQIVSYMKNIENSIFEIGRRLKFVKETMAHGSYRNWLEETLRFHPSTASRFIAAYDQFGNVATSQKIGTGKIFEMLALPESLNRQEFIEGVYVIPSTGETKNVEQMTVKELREVTKPLKEAEKKLKQVEKEVELATASVRQVVSGEEALKAKSTEHSMVENPSGELIVEYQAENNMEAISVVEDFSKDVWELVAKYSPFRLRFKEIESVDNHTQKKFTDSTKMLIEFINNISPDCDKSEWEKDQPDRYF